MADQILTEIKDRLNIADVIAGYIPIKKAGVNFKCPCPFHNEKTPSLVISPQKQIWHCFGCGEGGDVFGFVMKYENLEFKDALKILADKAGVKLPAYKPENKAQEDEKDILLRINDFAARYYHTVLMSKGGAVALDYLKNRGLTEETIKKWQIGFAPDDFHALEEALRSKNIAADLLVKAGVSAKNERGQMYDRFRGRITFPIYNYFGEIVGFSARILNDDGKSAKYVNSPETVIYNKSKTLFGLNFAKDAIRKSDEAVIVEGQMDCIQAHQAGFNNVIASSGTALNESSLTQLGRLTKNLKFCFDADGAGLAATRRAGELALKQGFRLKLIILNAVKDPDELIKRSPNLWQKAVSEAVWFLDYYIEQALEKFANDPVAQKHYLSTEVVPFLGNISDALEQDHYVHELVKKFGISESVIRSQIKREKPGLPEEKSAITPGQAGRLLQKEVLGGLLMFPDFLAAISDKIQPQDFEDSEIRALILVLLEPEAAQPAEADKSAFPRTGIRGSADDPLLTSPTEVGDRRRWVKQDALAKEALFMVESQLAELENDPNRLKRVLEKSFALLKVSAIKRRQQQLQTEMKAAEVAGNKTRVDDLNKEFAAILETRKEFEKHI